MKIRTTLRRRPLRALPQVRTLKASPPLPAVFAVLALAMLLVGCDSGATAAQPPAANSPHALAAVVAASRATANTAAEVQTSLSTGTTFNERTLSLSAAGAFDFARAEGSVLLSSVARGSRTPGRPQARLIFLPRTAYSRPLVGAYLKQKHRKPWVRINLVKGESLEANLPKYVAQLETLNPLLGLDEIAWGARAATVAGISGSQNAHTTVYAVTVDLQSALRRARGPNKTAFLAAVASRLSPAARLRLKNSSLLARLEAWVQQGRVVRLSMEALPGVHIAALTAFREVRTPVVIHAPPPNQSTDVAKLGPAGERESTGGGDSDGA